MPAKVVLQTDYLPSSLSPAGNITAVVRVPASTALAQVFMPHATRLFRTSRLDNFSKITAALR